MQLNKTLLKSGFSIQLSLVQQKNIVQGNEISKMLFLEDSMDQAKKKLFSLPMLESHYVGQTKRELFSEIVR